MIFKTSNSIIFISDTIKKFKITFSLDEIDYGVTRIGVTNVYYNQDMQDEELLATYDRQEEAFGYAALDLIDKQINDGNKIIIMPNQSKVEQLVKEYQNQYELKEIKHDI